MNPALRRLEVAGLQLAYRPRGLAPVVVLSGLDLDVSEGQLVAVTGASGSGKSTLLHAVGGMLRPDAGVIRLDGTDPWQLAADARAAWRNASLGFVFQAPRLLSELSAVENVALPAWIAREPQARARRDAEELLEALGLGDRLSHRPAELSGGEAQRVAVARALVRRPAILLADEPTGNLDRAAAGVVFERLLALQSERRFAALIATHDETLAGRCDRRVVLADGRARDAVPVSA